MRTNRCMMWHADISRILVSLHIWVVCIEEWVLSTLQWCGASSQLNFILEQARGPNKNTQRKNTKKYAQKDSYVYRSLRHFANIGERQKRSQLTQAWVISLLHEHNERNNENCCLQTSPRHCLASRQLLISTQLRGRIFTAYVLVLASVSEATALVSNPAATVLVSVSTSSALVTSTLGVQPCISLTSYFFW